VFPKTKWHFRSNDKYNFKIEHTPSSFLGQNNILVGGAGLFRETNGQMQLMKLFHKVRKIACTSFLFLDIFVVALFFQSIWSLSFLIGTGA
jgi:hypothetical protein